MSDLRDEFKADQLLDLDEPLFRDQVQRELTRIMQDIASRPCNGSGKVAKRKLTLSFEFVPIVKFDNNLGRHVLAKVGVTPDISVSIPKTRGGTSELRLVRKDGEPVPMWNPESPEDVDRIGPQLPFDKRQRAQDGAARMDELDAD